jgi:hypothetical protein
MRKYPKGCRYIIVENGTIGPTLKTTKPCHISTLTNWRWERSVIVQPRGKLKWFWFVGNKMMGHGYDPDALAMKALLSG